MLEAVVIEQAQLASVVEVRPAPAHITQTPPWYRPVTAQCVLEEAQRQQIEPIKLVSVLSHEAGRVGQFTPNSNGSYDIGPMQVNTVHLPDLAKTYGLPKSTVAQLLAYDGCFNVAVGSWLLRQATNAVNGDFWRGIGRYHSRTPERANSYILRVHGSMQKLLARASLPPAGRSNKPVAGRTAASTK